MRAPQSADLPSRAAPAAWPFPPEASVSSTPRNLEVFVRFDQLLEAARNGSRDAPGRLLETCRLPLLRLARRVLTPDVQAKGGASDLVQDTFLNALREI